MDKTMYINLIECKMIGNYISSFTITNASDKTPNMAKPAINACKRDGYYSAKFKIGEMVVYNICVRVGVDLSTIPERDVTMCNGIPKRIKVRYFEALRSKKLNLIRERIAQKIESL